METDHSEQSGDKSNDVERPKMESASSTSPKFVDNNGDSPILTLPADILAKIIAFIPTAQWPSFDLLRDFHDASRIAWRQLRDINLDRGLLIKPNDRSSLAQAIEYLVERSPFLTSLSGIDLRVEPNSDVIRSLAKFEHLQSISMGDAQFFVVKLLEETWFVEETSSFVNWPPEFFGHYRPGGVRLDALVEFLETTRSRTNLKQIQLFNVDQCLRCEGCDCVHFDVYATAMLDRFHSSLVNVREHDGNKWTQTRRPFKLEKFSFSTSDRSLYIRLDTLDASCLTELRLGVTNVGRTIGRRTYDRSAARVDPVQLTNLIDRAPNLVRIELFFGCKGDCRPHGLENNRELLAALARHENLTTIKFDLDGGTCGCAHFAPDFNQMLKAIGRRGQLRKLVLPDYIWPNDGDEICSTIHEYIPYLRSIKLCIDDIDRDVVSHIANMTELEEVHFSMDDRERPLDANVITKISQLSHLKRLAINGMVQLCWMGRSSFFNSLERLAMVATLTDLRIGDPQNISADVFEKWSEGFGPNLQTLMLSGYNRKYGFDEQNEGGLIHLLEKAVRLRILILEGRISDRSMMAIANSCPELEILGVRSTANEITARGLHEIVDRCTKLRRLGGISKEIRSQLVIPKYRKIGDDVDMEFWEYDFDDRYYE